MTEFNTTYHTALESYAPLRTTITHVDSNSHLSIPVGIIIGLLASFVQSLGLTIQRKSHVLNQSLPENRRRIEHRRPLWLLGFAIFISSNVLGSLVQIASLPVVILAPLGAVSLLWNAFFARLILGDVFSPWMILGTIFIAGGAILIAEFGIVPEPTRSLEDLLELFRRPAFVAYFSVLAFVVVVSLAITHIAEFSLSRRIAQVEQCNSVLLLTPSSTIIDLSHHSTEPTSHNLGENGDAAATERTPLLADGKLQASARGFGWSRESEEDALRSINRTGVLVAISYASFSGILSGMCLIFAKSGVELLLLTLRGQNQFWRWESWMLLLGLVVFALLQLWYLHKALILADPTLVCPSAFCFYNLSSIVNGMVYFNQLSLIKPSHIGLVTLGIIVLLGGVWIVSIQAGGGGVDVGPWSEETELLPADAPFCEEPEMERYGDEVPIDGVQEVSTSPKESPIIRVSAVPMERGTRSESSLPNVIVSPGIGNGSDTHRVSETSSTPRVRRPSSVLSDSSPSHRQPQVEAHHSKTNPTLPVSPTYYSRFTLRQRLSSTHDIYPNNRTVSHPHQHSSFALHNGGSGPLSPTLNPTGFQIGLSAVSPGFAIMPRERKMPRISGLGIGAAPLGDEERERVRRRTVSEGDVVRVFEDDNGHDNLGVAWEGEVSLGREAGTAEGQPVEDSESIPRTRWRWLRRIFLREEKE